MEAEAGVEQQTGIDDMLEALADGHKLVLSDNSVLVRRTVSGVKRLEFVPYATARFTVRERLVGIGFQHERLNYADRYAAPLERERQIVVKRTGALVPMP